MARTIGRPKAAAETDLMLAFDYARYSTKQQGSIKEQQAINDEIAEEGINNKPIKIIDRFKDEGVSRTVNDRPGLLDLFAAVRAHPEVRYLIVNELERLTAGPRQRADVVLLTKNHNITILTEDGVPIDPHDEEAMIAADERAIGAKKEAIRARRRTRRNLRQKVMAGTVAKRPPYGVRAQPLIGPNGDPLPAGFIQLDSEGKRIRSGKIEIHPDEIEWLQRIFDWSDQGMANDEIARKLNDAGVPTKTGKNPWRGNTVGGILGNPFYKGDMIWGLQETLEDADGKFFLRMREEGNNQIYIGESPLGEIVDRVLWERLADKRDARESERAMSRRTEEGQPLDGLVYCGKCGHKMYGRNDIASRRSALRRQGKPVDHLDGKVIWRYVCYSSRPGNIAKAGFGPLCEKHWTMPLSKILEAFRFAAIMSAVSPDVPVGELDVPCGNCSVEAGAECVTKGGRLYRTTGNGTLSHSVRIRLAAAVEEARSGATGDTSADELFKIAPSQPVDLNIERRLIEHEIDDLLKQLDRNYELAFKTTIPAERIEAKNQELQAAIEDLRGRLDGLAQPTAPSEEVVMSTARDLGRLADLLADPALPLDDKIAGVAASGIERIFVDDPRVQVQLAG